MELKNCKFVSYASWPMDCFEAFRFVAGSSPKNLRRHLRARPMLRWRSPS
jgi:hypothetical protein